MADSKISDATKSPSTSDSSGPSDPKNSQATSVAPSPTSIPEDAADQAATDLLEKALNEHDPDFQNSLSGIGPDLMPENMDMFGLDADIDSFDDRKVKKILTKLKTQLKHQLKVLQARFLLFFKQTIPDLLKESVSLLKAGVSQVTGVLKKFSAMTLAQKGTILACLLLTVITGLFIHRFTTKGFLPEKIELYTPQLDELASESFLVGAEEPMSSFYDSPRVSQNVMSLKRMVVNIRSSDNSGPQPMVAIEFFVEGYAPEVVIEVKDREAEIQDLFQRIIEGFTYDDLDSAVGKRNLQDRLRDRINQILTQGNVKRVFFRNLILKP